MGNNDAVDKAEEQKRQLQKLEDGNEIEMEKKCDTWNRRSWQQSDSKTRGIEKKTKNRIEKRLKADNNWNKDVNDGNISKYKPERTIMRPDCVTALS